MRCPEFEAYIAPARLYPQIWRLIIGMALILFTYAGFMGLIFWAGFAATFPLGFLGWSVSVINTQGAVPTLIWLLTFTGMALGPVIAAPACHYRPPSSLFGPLSDTARGFASATIVALFAYAVYFAVSIFTAGPVANLPLFDWLRYLPTAVLLILLQTSAEELVFRGYLQQQLAARFKSRIIWMILPSALFAALHWDKTLGDTLWLALLVLFVLGMIAADLTEKTGSLGAAIGLHFGHNIVMLLIISAKDTLDGLALFVTPFNRDDGAAFSLALGADLLLLLVSWRILRIVLDR